MPHQHLLDMTIKAVSYSPVDALLKKINVKDLHYDIFELFVVEHTDFPPDTITDHCPALNFS